MPRAFHWGQQELEAGLHGACMPCSAQASQTGALQAWRPGLPHQQLGLPAPIPCRRPGRGPCCDALAPACCPHSARFALTPPRTLAARPGRSRGTEWVNGMEGRRIRPVHARAGIGCAPDSGAVVSRLSGHRPGSCPCDLRTSRGTHHLSACSLHASGSSEHGALLTWLTTEHNGLLRLLRLPDRGPLHAPCTPRALQPITRAPRAQPLFTLHTHPFTQ